MDGDAPNVVKLDQKKRVSISRLDKIFKVFHICNILSLFLEP